MLFRVKLVWLAEKSKVAAAMATSAVTMSLGARAASVMEPPSSSSNSPSGTVNCRLTSPRGPAYTSAASCPVALCITTEGSSSSSYCGFVLPSVQPPWLQQSEPARVELCCSLAQSSPPSYLPCEAKLARQNHSQGLHNDGDSQHVCGSNHLRKDST